jgi:ATP-dependent RNA helicase RhlE
MSLLKKIARTLVGKSPTEVDENKTSSDDLIKHRPKRNNSNTSSNNENENKSEDKRKPAPKKKRPPNKNSNRNSEKSSDGQSDRNSNRGEGRNKKAFGKNSKSPHQKRNQNQNNSNKNKVEPRENKFKKSAERQADPEKVVKTVDPIGFKDMGLRPEILKAIGEEGYVNPTPIQQASIGELLKGRDVLGCAQTGTGKTASFALPTLHCLSQETPQGRPIRALVLTPTRELALQIHESYITYGRYLDLRSTVVYGGVGADPQRKALRRGVDVLVATPGRLLDLHNQGCIKFGKLEYFILDEADSMLDMGFLPDVKRIIKLLPTKRKNLMFSATMPNDIEKLSMNVLRDPVKVEVAPVSSASERVEQSLYFVNRNKKKDLLLHVLEKEDTTRVLVFTRTKAIANRVTKFLIQSQISSEAIHGNKSQSARQRALENFKEGKTRVLVATDLAARGLDIDTITHVINYDLPNIPETYVHRIGRTGRAEAEGISISFCEGDEQSYVRTIQNLIGKDIPVVDGHPFPYNPKDEPEPRKQGGQNKPRGNRPPRNNNNRPSSKGRPANRSKAGGGKKPGGSRGRG